MLTAACCTTGCRRLNAQSTVVKMRRLARAYQAKLNFYLINRGELPDYEGAAGAAGDGRSVVVGAVSALRAKQPYDFTFDPHSELSVEKLKEWIDLFLAGKLKKVRSHRSSYAQLQLAHVAAVALRRARPSKSCRTAHCLIPDCQVVEMQGPLLVVNLESVAVRQLFEGRARLRATAAT